MKVAREIIGVIGSGLLLYGLCHPDASPTVRFGLSGSLLVSTALYIKEE